MNRFCFRTVFLFAGLIAIAAAAVQAQSTSRPLAAGVLTTIPPTPVAEETFSGPLPLVELPINVPDLAYPPNFEAKSATAFERAKHVILRRGIWNLELSFKPMRMIEVDVPQPSGRMQRKLIWYMVYRVKNPGGHLSVKEEKRLFQDTVEETTFSVEPVAELTEKVAGENGQAGERPLRIRFFPHFVLESKEFDKAYLDRVIPAAMEPILNREFPPQSRDEDFVLHNSLTISSVDIKPEESAWGVVTWEDIDPRIDYFSVYVQGLTNAYKFEDPEGGYQQGDPPGSGRKFLRKTLQLNFWRPGDTVEQNEEEINFGVRLEGNPQQQQQILKLYGVDKPIDHQWVYR